jgi:hypothetical protein
MAASFTYNLIKFGSESVQLFYRLSIHIYSPFGDSENREKNYLKIRDLLSIALFNILGTHYYTPRNELVGGYTGFTMSVRPSACPSVRPSVRPSVCLSVCLSVRPSVRPLAFHI